MRSVFHLLAGASLLALAACAGRPSPNTTACGTSATSLLLPGDARLGTLTLAGGPHRIAVTARRSDTSAARPFGAVTRVETLMPSDGALIYAGSRWDPPQTSVDSLVVRRDGLFPVYERLAFRGARFEFNYEGRRVTGSYQPPDSAARVVAVDYPFPVFAFNQVEMLVRTVPMCPGSSVVVPLFSPVDRALERDTITVIGPATDSPGSANVWLVRFADPVIYTVYRVQASDRRILDSETTQRRSGTRILYAAPRD